MSIATETMLVNLSIGVWAGYKLDKERSAEVTAQANAQYDAARVNKHLAPRESLARVTSAAGALRTHFYAGTLPWSDAGARLLPRKNYIPFMTKHNELKAAFAAEVAQFVQHTYPSMVSQAEFRMGEMFRHEDYPSGLEIVQKFYVDFEILPVATSHDFRVDMDANEAERIRADIEDSINAKITRAAQEPMRQITEALTHFYERLKAVGDTSDGDGRVAGFRSKRLDDLRELADLLPRLNFTHDLDIERMCERVQSLVGGVTPKELRESETVRSDVMQAAEEMLADMAGLARAFQSAA